MTKSSARWLTGNIATIDGFLSASECQAHIDSSELTGFEEASINSFADAGRRLDVRNNERRIEDSVDIATTLWTRLAPHIDNPYHDRWEPVGLNERIRFYRYDPGQKFDWHLDGHFARSADERSLLTFMVYLNEECDGGETLFTETSPREAGNLFDPEVSFRITPKTGRALIFLHGLMHKGDTVRSGQKYVLRSDVMFKRLPF